MEAELTFYIGRERYERRGGREVNYRNGGYNRRFTLKGIGEVVVNVPETVRVSIKQMYCRGVVNMRIRYERTWV